MVYLFHSVCLSHNRSGPNRALKYIFIIFFWNGYMEYNWIHWK